MSPNAAHLVQSATAPVDDELSTFFRQSHIALYIASPEGDLIDVNLAAANLLGASSAAEILAARHNVFNWRLSRNDRRAFAALLERNEPAQFIRSRLKISEGVEISVEEHACRTQTARIIGALDVVRAGDQPAGAVHAGDRRFTELYEHAAIGIYRSTRDGFTVSANPAFTRMMGYASEDELLAANYNADDEWYVEPTRRAEFVSEVERAGKVVNFESEIYRHKTREKIWVSETARAVRNERGETLYFEGTIEDITRRKEMERDLAKAKAEAERANRLKSEFLANMSHELRTPLNGIIGGADVILSQNVEPVVREFAEIIKGSGEHLLTLLNDILDLSKIEAGHMIARRDDVPLASIVELVRQNFRVQAEKKGLAFDVVLDPSAPASVATDEVRLRQILFNLLGNAFKFTDRGSVKLTIAAATAPAGSELTFAVADTGCGISEEAIPRIFLPFEQADGSTTRKYGGTGLGLALSARFAELLGGAVAATSAVGEGSVFTLRIPLEKAAPVAADRRAPILAAVAPSAPAAARSWRVLVADDNHMNTMVVAALLKQIGCEASVVTNGAEAVEAVKSSAFDAVLMDVNMPTMDGVAATVAIRALGGAYATLPIVALTANAMAGDKERYLAAGMTDYLSKPVLLKSLRDAIERLQSRRPA